MVSVLVVFARNQLLSTDAYVSTVAPLAANPAVQTQVATRVSEELVARTDLEPAGEGALPNKAGFLATPITDGVETATNSVLKVVQSQAVRTGLGGGQPRLPQAAGGRPHRITGGFGDTKGGKITIDLSQVELNVKQELDAKGITVFDKVPAVKGLNFVLFQSQDLVRMQGVMNSSNELAMVLPIVTLLLFAGFVVLAGNRRRGLVRAGAGLALSMAADPGGHRCGPQPVPRGVEPRPVPGPPPRLSTGHGEAPPGLRIILGVSALIAVWRAAGRERLGPGQGGGHEEGRAGWRRTGPPLRRDHRQGPAVGGPGPGPVVLVIWSDPTALVALIVVAVALVVVGLLGVFAGAGRRPAVAGPSGGRSARARAGAAPDGEPGRGT